MVGVVVVEGLVVALEGAAGRENISMRLLFRSWLAVAPEYWLGVVTHSDVLATILLNASVSRCRSKGDPLFPPPAPWLDGCVP